jgi:F5/8 type C domain
LSAFSFPVRIAAALVLLAAFGGGCAEGTQGELNPDALVDGGTGASAGTGGTDAGATGGVPTAGDTAMPAAGKSSAGTTSTAGAGGTPVATGGNGGKGGGGSNGGSGGKGGAAGSGGTAGSGGGKGGAGGVAGMPGGGMAGSGGAAPTTFRYVKLVAVSEQNGNVWSSVAELQVFTTGDTMLARTAWVASADSQETVSEMAPASQAIDGDTATYWHSEWSPAPDNVNDAKLPHSLVVDMGSVHALTGFSYLPRQNNVNGRIKGWEFYASNDGKAWGSALKTGSFPSGTALQKVTF